MHEISPDHRVWESQEKSHSTIWAMRAKFTFWVDKSWLKMPEMVNFATFWKLEVCCQNSATRQIIFSRTKMVGKCQKKTWLTPFYIWLFIHFVKCDSQDDFQTLWHLCSRLFKCSVIFVYVAYDSQKSNFLISINCSE